MPASSRSLRRCVQFTAACLGFVLAAACSSDSTPKQAQQSPVPATAGATAQVTAAVASSGTGVPSAPTPPPGASDLTARDYPDTEAVSLSCDAPNLLVLRTRAVTLYLQTLVASNYQCEQARQALIQGSGPGPDSDPNSARGKALSISVTALEQQRPSGSFTVTFTWKGGNSVLLTVLGGWQGPGA